MTSDEHSALLHRPKFVPQAISRHLAFELREGEQDVLNEPTGRIHRPKFVPQAIGSVKILRDRYEMHSTAFEQVHQSNEVDDCSRNPVQFVNDYHINKPALDVP